MITASDAYNNANDTDYLLNYINGLIESASIKGQYSVKTGYVTLPKHIWDSLRERGFKVYGMIGYYYEDNWDRIMLSNDANTRDYIITWRNSDGPIS